MQPPFAFMFGPYGNGTRFAGLSLLNFLAEIHANWSEGRRQRLTDDQSQFNSWPQATIASTLQDAFLTEDTQRRLVRLGHYIPAFKDVERCLTNDQIEALRLALPLNDPRTFDGHNFSLRTLRYDLRAWAAVTALYELLLCTRYWQERGELKAEEAYSPDTLGLLSDHDLDPNHVQPQLNAFRRELKLRNESHYAFHPLYVMACLFNPTFFERLLAAGLVDLMSERTAARHMF